MLNEGETCLVNTVYSGNGMTTQLNCDRKPVYPVDMPSIMEAEAWKFRWICTGSKDAGDVKQLHVARAPGVD